MSAFQRTRQNSHSFTIRNALKKKKFSYKTEKDSEKRLFFAQIFELFFFPQFSSTEILTNILNKRFGGNVPLTKKKKDGD